MFAGADSLCLYNQSMLENRLFKLERERSGDVTDVTVTLEETQPDWVAPGSSALKSLNTRCYGKPDTSCIHDFQHVVNASFTRCLTRERRVNFTCSRC